MPFYQIKQIKMNRPKKTDESEGTPLKKEGEVSTKEDE